MSKLKAIFVVGACLLGTLFLANTPDEVPTGEDNIEAQVLEQNHQQFLAEMQAKEERLRRNVSAVMNEADARSNELSAKRADIDARTTSRAEHQAVRAEIEAKQAEIDAEWGTKRPRGYKEP